MTATSGRIVALSGGIGGAKLALGLAHTLAPEALTVIANTGDDFEHFGLAISPDVDTLIYTLAGIANPDTGWGRHGETWSFMETMRTLGGADWFQLGDRDLAVHVLRTHRLATGARPTEVSLEIARSFGLSSSVLPMTDTPVRTFVDSDQGRLSFQDYFVRRKCVPKVSGLDFDGAAAAALTPEISEALSTKTLRAVIICPSNPLISIDPILAVPGMRPALRNCGAPVIAVSPIIAGRAIKGPTVKMLSELGFAATAAGVARHYGDLIDGFVCEEDDLAEVAGCGFDFAVEGAKTVMTSLATRRRLAESVLAFADRLRQDGALRGGAERAEAAPA